MVLPNSSFSQSRVGIGYGYNLPFLEDDLPDGNFEAIIPGDSQQRNTVAKASYGKGNEYILFSDFKISKNVRIGFQSSFLDGKETVQYLNLTNRKNTFYYSGSSIRLSPYLCFVNEIGKDSKFSLHNKIGIVFGINNGLTIKRDFVSSNNTTYSVFEYTRGSNIGVTTGIGIAYKISPNFSISVDASGIFQKFRPQQGKLITYIVNDENLLNSLTERERVIKYVKEINIDYTTNPNDNAPALGLLRSYSFSSIGLQIFLIYQFKKD